MSDLIRKLSNLTYKWRIAINEATVSHWGRIRHVLRPQRILGRLATDGAAVVRLRWRGRVARSQLTGQSADRFAFFLFALGPVGVMLEPCFHIAYSAVRFRHFRLVSVGPYSHQQITARPYPIFLPSHLIHLRRCSPCYPLPDLNFEDFLCVLLVQGFIAVPFFLLVLNIPSNKAALFKNKIRSPLAWLVEQTHTRIRLGQHVL